VPLSVRMTGAPAGLGGGDLGNGAMAAARETVPSWSTKVNKNDCVRRRQRRGRITSLATCQQSVGRSVNIGDSSGVVGSLSASGGDRTWTEVRLLLGAPPLAKVTRRVTLSDEQEGGAT
jgi:hypothetical protein